MAMNGVVLGDAMLAAIDNAVALTPGAGAVQRAAIWRAVGSAIVSHIVNNAAITVTSVSGVTTGTGSSGSGSGTIA